MAQKRIYMFEMIPKTQESLHTTTARLSIFLPCRLFRFHRCWSQSRASRSHSCKSRRLMKLVEVRFAKRMKVTLARERGRRGNDVAQECGRIGVGIEACVEEQN